jgi:RNA polymerase-binding transcription factor DksA
MALLSHWRDQFHNFYILQDKFFDTYLHTKSGGIKMTYDRYTSIIQELTESLKELEASQSQHPLIQHYIDQEISDVRRALQLADQNRYGLCEMSGEEIPFDLIKMNPTLTSLTEANEWKRYGKIQMSSWQS